MAKFSNNRPIRQAGLPAQAGLVKTIILIVGALVLLKYVFNLDVIGMLTTGKFRELWDKMYGLAKIGWNNYSVIFLNFWSSAISKIKSLLGK